MRTGYTSSIAVGAREGDTHCSGPELFPPPAASQLDIGSGAVVGSSSWGDL